jgi:ketosteroid isomerase-like protein
MVAVALSIACTGTQSSSDDAVKSGATSAASAADSAAIVAIEGRLQAAALAANWDAWGAEYVADPVRYPPNAQPVMGKAASDAFNRASPKFTAFKLATTLIVVRGDLAAVSGTFKLSIGAGKDAAGKATPAASDEGKFMQLLMKQADGSWKVARDIWNSSLPVPAAAAAAAK